MRMRAMIVGTGCAVLAMAAAPVASAQLAMTPVAASPGKDYRFRHSKLRVPPVLDGLPRTGVRQFGADELDVFAKYERGSDMLTVYVYRLASGGVPVWFDRARASIEARSELFGTVTPAMAPAAFTPPGQSSASGLMGAWSMTKPPYRGTALALLPMGDWLVKIRYTSTTLDGAGVAARMPAVLAALDWPAGMTPAPAAAPVADCATPLAFPVTAEPVRDAKALSMAAVASGLMASAGAKAKATTPVRPVTWCRDPAPATVGAAYRADAAADAYLLAFSDSGRGAFVAPDVIGQEVAQSAGRQIRQWSIALVDLGITSAYPPMTALPRPDQVFDAMKGPVLSRTTTWGKKTQISINPDVLK